MAIQPSLATRQPVKAGCRFNRGLYRMRTPEGGQGEDVRIIGLGFLLGVQHALEADHIAAVSSIAARRSEVGDIVKHG